MSPLPRIVQAKIALAIVGIVLWGYGVRSDDRRFYLAGIGILLLAFLLRFVGRRAPPRTR